jgi:hypothetical protein
MSFFKHAFVYLALAAFVAAAPVPYESQGQVGALSDPRPVRYYRSPAHEPGLPSDELPGHVGASRHPSPTGRYSKMLESREESSSKGYVGASRKPGPAGRYSKKVESPPTEKEGHVGASRHPGPSGRYPKKVESRTSSQGHVGASRHPGPHGRYPPKSESLSSQEGNDDTPRKPARQYPRRLKLRTTPQEDYVGASRHPSPTGRYAKRTDLNDAGLLVASELGSLTNEFGQQSGQMITEAH